MVLTDIHLKWLNLFHFLVLMGVPFVVQIGCMIFLLLLLDVIRMPLSTVSFLAQIDCGVLCLQNTSLYDLNGFKSRVNRHLSFFFLINFLMCFSSSTSCCSCNSMLCSGFSALCEVIPNLKKSIRTSQSP